jgi:hypothetical protein
MTLTVTIGFNEIERPAEFFCSAQRTVRNGRHPRDASVVISVALQQGIATTALAKSISRAPDDLGRITAAFVIGAALDRLVAYERSRT